MKEVYESVLLTTVGSLDFLKNFNVSFSPLPFPLIPGKIIDSPLTMDYGHGDEIDIMDENENDDEDEDKDLVEACA